MTGEELQIERENLILRFNDILGRFMQYSDIEHSDLSLILAKDIEKHILADAKDIDWSYTEIVLLRRAADYLEMALESLQGLVESYPTMKRYAV